MAFDRTWRLYDTLTGTILAELPCIDDQVTLDINSLDEASLTIPAYALTDDQRLNWSSYLGVWNRGIALIDNTKAWNAPGAVLYAGFIIKRSFDIITEEIEIGSVGYYEYMKKLIVERKFPNTVDPGYTGYQYEFTGDSWGAVMSAVLERGFRIPSDWPAGAPRPANVIRNKPATGGTGKRYVIYDQEQQSIASVFEEIRDQISDKGNEFRFTPAFRASDKKQLVWDFVVASDDSPHLNFTNLDVPLAYNANAPWQVSSYRLDDDATLNYNRITVIYSEGDQDNTGASYVTGVINGGWEGPLLEESFNTNTSVNRSWLAPKWQELAEEQARARMKNPLVTDKNIELSVSQDVDLVWFNHIGKKAILNPGKRSAGAGAVGRVVGIGFSSKNRENDISIDIMRIADRYPKLPKQLSAEVAGGGPGYYGGGPGGTPGIGAGDIGDLPTGVTPDPSGNIPGGDVHIPTPAPSEGAESGAEDPTTAATLITLGDSSNDLPTPRSNVHDSGYAYYLKDFGSTSNNNYYNNRTDKVDDITVSSVKFEYNNENFVGSVKDKKGPDFVIPGADIDAALGALPDTVTQEVYGNEGTKIDEREIGPGSSPYGDKAYLYTALWTIKDRLYINIIKKRAYGAEGTYLHKQATLVLTINSDDGTLSTLKTTSLFGISALEGSPKGIYLSPHLGTFGSSYVQSNHEWFKADDKTIYFMNVYRFIDTIPVYLQAGGYRGGLPDLTYWENNNLTQNMIDGRIEPIVGDFSAPGFPTYEKSDISHFAPMGQTKTEPLYAYEYAWDGSKFIPYTTQYAGYTTNLFDMHSAFYFNPTTKIVYAVMYGDGSPAFYNKKDADELEALLTDYLHYVWKCDVGKREKKFSKIGSKYTGLLSNPISNQVALLPNAINENWYTDPGSSAIKDYKTTSVLKYAAGGGKVVKNYTENGSSSRNMFVFWGYQNDVDYIPTDENTNIMLRQNNQYPYLTYVAELPSPYQFKAKEASSNLVLDKNGDVWVYGGNNPLRGEDKRWDFQSQVPYLTKIDKKFERLTSNTGGDIGFGIDEDGLLWGWGNKRRNILLKDVDNDRENQWKPVLIAGGEGDNPHKWQKVLVANTFAAGIDEDGYLFTWGSNETGATAQGTYSGNVNIPTKVGDAKYLDIDINVTGLIVIDEYRDAYYAGSIGPIEKVNTLTPMEGNKKWNRISLGYAHAMGIDIDKQLWGTGNNLSGCLGIGQNGGLFVNWHQVETGVNIVDIEAAFAASFIIDSNGRLYRCGLAENTGANDDMGLFYSYDNGEDIGVEAPYKRIYKAGNSVVVINEQDEAMRPASTNNNGSNTWPDVPKDFRPLFGDESKFSGDEGFFSKIGFGGGNSYAGIGSDDDK